MNLSEVAYFTRRLIILGFAALILYALGRLTINLLYDLYLSYNPPPLPPSDLRFGKLPKLNLPQLALGAGSSPVYLLETANGAFPQTPHRLKVYRLGESEYTLLSAVRAKTLAKRLRFEGETQVLSATDYLWNDAENGRQLKMEIVGGNFSMMTDYDVAKHDFIPGRLYGTEESIAQARNFLSAVSLLKKDLENGWQEINFLKIEENKLARAESLARGQLSRVDFFRQIEDALEASPSAAPLLSQNPKFSPVYVVVSSHNKDERRFPEASFFYSRLDPKDFGTYPSKSMPKAWEELQKNQGISYLRLTQDDPFTPYKPLSLRQVFIRQIYVAYYDPPQTQKYLQPIYVFQGEAQTETGQKAEYIAYVSAIEEEWVE